MPQLPWFEDPEVFQKKRKQLGLTQHQLSKIAKVPRSLIADIETGRRTLTGEIADALWNTLHDVSYKRRKELAEAETQTGHFLESVERARAEHPDFDEVMRKPHMAKFAWMIPPKDPKALEAWKASTAKRLIEDKAAIARQFGSYANFQEVVAAGHRVAAQERQIAALQAEVAAQAEQIAALRDLLDIKTKEVLLRDQIESATTATEPEKKTDG